MNEEINFAMCVAYRCIKDVFSNEELETDEEKLGMISWYVENCERKIEEIKNGRESLG